MSDRLGPVDHYEVGAALVHAGARHAGLDTEGARWAIGEDPAAVEQIGEAFAPTLLALAQAVTSLCETLSGADD